MTSTAEVRCRRCGALIPGKPTENLCPACLLSGALQDAGTEARTLSMVPGEPHSREQPSEFPCEFGGYRLLGFLGRGGMGAVYEAEQLATGRRVALKMLGRHIDSPEMRHRFLREGRLAAGVNHPNSLYVFGSEEVLGTPVITMEIAAGGTLKDRLKERGPLPVAEAVDAILDVISGLEAVYAEGVLHRDIKPSNCFVAGDGSVKVGDFGLSISTMARSDTFVTAQGELLGTPAYASPEQLRGAALDVRSDIYSVGATLFTLLTHRAPFEGDNAVQVIANAVNQEPPPLTELRGDVPPALDRVVARCLAKEPDGRYIDYMTLRNALLPFSSQVPEPASLTVRAAAGWIDYLIAFLTPYVVLMLTIGNEQFHFGLIMERTVYSARYYVAFLFAGFLYFSIAEGIWGAGLGKKLKGLRVVRPNGRPPGVGRALIRIVVPVFCIEGVRIPILLSSISATRVAELTISEIVVYSVATTVCPWIPVLLSMKARREGGFATVWDLASRTRVVVEPRGTVRPSVTPAAAAETPVGVPQSLGPYRIATELVPGTWIVAADPVLRRHVWLLRRRSSEISPARRNLARPGRMRWLQKVETAEATWDAFEATPGAPFSGMLEGGSRVPWGTLRLWLDDLASELQAATGDRTLPAELSLDHVWVTAQGRAVLLDEPYPGVTAPHAGTAVGDLSGQLRFLNTVAARVESTSLPLHARELLRNLEEGDFESLSSVSVALQSLLDKPTEVGRGIRAGSIFMLPLYIWVMVVVGSYRGAGWFYEMVQGSTVWAAMTITMLVLAGGALIQALLLPLRTSTSHAIFRLAIVNADGEPARASQLMVRWAIVWLPLFLPMSIVAVLVLRGDTTLGFILAASLLLTWNSAAVYAVLHPNRGLHDRLAGTWVVRR